MLAVGTGGTASQSARRGRATVPVLGISMSVLLDMNYSLTAPAPWLTNWLSSVEGFFFRIFFFSFNFSRMGICCEMFQKAELARVTLGVLGMESRIRWGFQPQAPASNGD